ncbi:hypothetical protein J5N97_007485 [Dioscorea zingiberensis]|uniref:Uncharacterized protein n=1 Tax=Dioscorea zingiberensis TaxID=325984 RepID=A0A9D5DCP6_9LILI|nr:hypothetical protein J5N97_007485 [Dioscorea zingiberensis]
MGVSFKVARTGSRYRPHPPPPDPPPSDEAGSVPPPAGTGGKVGLLGLGHCLADHSVSSVNCEKNPDGQEELPASFSLNLFPDGFSIGKPNEGMPLPLVKDLPKVLHPYDRASKSLFSAIENGWLPGEILEDLPCNYINGTITCEVWDYRSFMAKLVSNDISDDEFPKVQKVRLQMGMETVVKDMPLISDDAWTYNDLLQAESRIIKALQPVLYLEPKPSLDRLCKTPVLTQLDLGIYGTKVKGKHHIGLESELKCTRQPSRMDVPSNTFSQDLKSQPSDAPKGEKICPTQCTPRSLPNMELQKYDGLGQALPLTSQYGSVINGSFSSRNAGMVPSITRAQDEVVKGSCICLKDLADFPAGNSDKLTPGVPCLKPTLKRPKQEPQDFDTYPTISTKKTRLLEPDLQRKITALCKRQESQDIHNMLHSASDNYSHPQMMNEAISGRKMVPDGQTPFPLNKRNAQSSVVKEPIEFETKNLAKAEALNDVEEQTLNIRSSKSYQNLPLASTKAWPPQMCWTNASSSIEKPLRKEIASRRKKSLGTTQVSAGCSLNSQDSQVGEKQMNVIQVSHIMRQNASVIEMSKGNVTSVPAASNGNAFLNSSSCNFLICANQNSSRTKKNSRSNGKNPTLASSCNGSQGAANETNIPFCSNSFLVRTPSVQFLSEDESYCAIRMKFSKIEMVVKRHGLNKTKNKNEKFLKSRSLPHSPLGQCSLIMTEDTENFTPFAERKFMSKSILSCSRNTCITRILSYRRVRILFSSNGMPCFLDDSWSKLILSEFDEPDDHKVAAEIIYGDKQERFHFGHLPTTHHADLYASQFTSLMERDEYELVDDQIQFHPSPATPASTSNSILLQIGSRGSAELPCDVHFLNHPTETTPFTTKSIPTLKYLGYQSQNVLSPMIPSSSQNLTRPLKREFALHLNSLYMQQPPSQRLLPLLQKNSLDATTIPMLNQPPNSPRLQRLNLQQFQQQQYQQSIMQQNISVNNLRGHFVASDDQVSEFCSSNNQQVNRGTSSVQAAVLARLNRSQSMGRGFIAGVPMRGSSGGIVRTTDGSLLSQALGMTSSNHNQSRARRSRNLRSNNNDLLHQHQAQAARLQQPEDWQRGQLVLPQQNGSPVGTQMSQTTPTSPMQFCSGSVLQQLNAGINIVSSPQLSTQTVGSGGSRTSSPMKLQCVGKGSLGGIGNPCKKERNS